MLARQLRYAILCCASLGALDASADIWKRDHNPGFKYVIPTLEYRTGPYAAEGNLYANGFNDYIELLNLRDGGIEGVELLLVPCETAYRTQMGVKCYERTKNLNGGALVYNPPSHAIADQLIIKSHNDKIPLIMLGSARTVAVDGTVFPWAFNIAPSYLEQADVQIQYIADKIGSAKNLQWQKIALLYHDSPYGREALYALEALSEAYGFNLIPLPITPPGLDQREAWLRVRVDEPHWILLRGWDKVNSIAIREAASIRWPMDHLIGSERSGRDSDILPVNSDAEGYLSTALGAGAGRFPLHQEILRRLYTGRDDKKQRTDVGQTSYNRGLLSAVWITESIRAAIALHETPYIDSQQMRDGVENVHLDAARINILGLRGFIKPQHMSCRRHSVNSGINLRRWDSKKKIWKRASKYYRPNQEVLSPLIQRMSQEYAAKHEIYPRTCDGP